jgi:hypothetical protein
MMSDRSYAMLTEDYGMYSKFHVGEVVEVKHGTERIVPNEGEKVEVLTQRATTTWIPTRILAPCQKPANWEQLLDDAFNS